MWYGVLMQKNNELDRKTFWDELPKPFFVLAPMEDVTDVVFRQVVERAAPPDVFFTEFMNVDGFCHPEGRKSVSRRLETYDSKVPLVAQIWGTDPEKFAKTAFVIASENGLSSSGLTRGSSHFSGIDINMGCPDKSVVRVGGGTGLIQNPERAVDIIKSVKESVLSSSDSFRGSRQDFRVKPESDGINTDFAVSVKTRIGYSKVDEWQPWLTTLLEQELDALSVHLRTRKEMSKVPAHYELIPEIIKLRNTIAPNTKLVINGDINSVLQVCPAPCDSNGAAGQSLYEKNPGIDGFMIGRGVFANPFCFEKESREHSKEELIDLLKYHLDLFDRLCEHSEAIQRDIKYEPLKKFFKIYINNFPGAADLRAKLMETKSTSEAREIVNRL